MERSAIAAAFSVIARRCSRSSDLIRERIRGGASERLIASPSALHDSGNLATGKANRNKGGPDERQRRIAAFGFGGTAAARACHARYVPTARQFGGKG